MKPTLILLTLLVVGCDSQAQTIVPMIDCARFYEGGYRSIRLNFLYDSCGGAKGYSNCQYLNPNNCPFSEKDWNPAAYGMIKAEHPTNIPCIQCKCIQICGSELGKTEPIDPRLYDCTEHDKGCK